jgi:hypothetical protein
MKNKCPSWRSQATSRPRCQGRVGFAFTGAQRTPLTEEAGGLGAVFPQEGQAGVLLGIRQWKSEKTCFDPRRDRANGTTTCEEDEQGCQNPRSCCQGEGVQAKADLSTWQDGAIVAIVRRLLERGCDSKSNYLAWSTPKSKSLPPYVTNAPAAPDGRKQYSPGARGFTGDTL